MTAVELPLVEPGTPEWLSTMSASKVAAALGLSPFESPFSLWHRMAGNIGAVDETDEMRRGHYLEPAIAAWFEDQAAEVTEPHRHPEYDRVNVARCGTFQSVERPWQTASPDRIIYPAFTTNTGHVIYDEDDPIALLECKTSADDHEWGEQGTDEIPIYYRVQAIWQMDTTGIRRCYVACLTSFLEFRWYVVDYDPDEADQIRQRAREFMDTLATGVAPAIDESAHTYAAIRELHPDIDPTDVELTNETAQRFLIARSQLKRAEAFEQQARSVVADEMGNAAKATWDGSTIARRQARGDGRPYVVAAKNLPTLPNQPEEAAA